MRINKFIATHTPHSRRVVDKLVNEGRVVINGHKAHIGQLVKDGDIIDIDGSRLTQQHQRITTIKLHKPTGYVCSRHGQGAPTIYQLLPTSLQSLQLAGRLDKDSSGLIILSTDGGLLQRLTHPRFNKQKVYQIKLNKPLEEKDKQHIEIGVKLQDGSSRMKVHSGAIVKHAEVTLSEGRNRQIRRTFEALGYNVVSLHRTAIDDIHLNELPSGAWQKIKA